MERILSDDDKIRRAEEICYRRNHKNMSMNYNFESGKKSKSYFGSKILLDTLILAISAVLIFSIKNKDYIFSENFLQMISEYNVDVIGKVKGFINDNEEILDNQTNTANENIEANQAELSTNNEENVENSSDSQNVQNEISFIKPIEGIITSRFGVRESEYSNVSGTHTGIDIAADSGTGIISAISGVVEQVSSDGDYGNHVKITKDSVSTLYAHCNDIYVSEGQEIVQGQLIATVGSTGNSTGPHLHFEVRKDNISINPEEVIQF